MTETPQLRNPVNLDAVMRLMDPGWGTVEGGKPDDGKLVTGRGCIAASDMGSCHSRTARTDYVTKEQVSNCQIVDEKTLKERRTAPP